MPGNDGKPALIRPCGATFPQRGRLGYIFYPVICRLPGNILHQHRLQLHPAQSGFQRIRQLGKIRFQAAGFFVAVVLAEGHKIVAAPLQKLAYRALGVLRCVYAVLLPLAFVWAVVRHLCALPMVLRRRTAGAALPWLLLFGLLAMAALRCGMIAFVEVSSFGIGPSTMYLSTVHPLLLLYTYGCLICYRNKGVITE